MKEELHLRTERFINAAKILMSCYTPSFAREAEIFYTPGDEYEVMLHDVKLCKQLGCDGVVIGLLNEDGTIDVKRTAALIEIAYPMGVTVHRAFDRCRDAFEALEQLVQIGCERILTSGQQPTVNEGMDQIAELNKTADHRIIIMPGSGVRKENITILREKTGCTEFHSSLRGKEKSKMLFIHPAFENSAESYMNNSIDALEVRALKKILNET
jgi:copper homeostasis protein